MGRTLPPVRYIKREQVCIGDTIKVVSQVADMRRSVTGTVGKRHYYGQYVDILTEKGMELLEYNVNTQPVETITLISRPRNTGAATLDGIDF